MKLKTKEVFLTAIIGSPLYAFAFDEVLRNVADWLTGPIAVSSVLIGTTIAGLVYLFGGVQKQEKVYEALKAGLFLFSVQIIVRTLQSFTG